MPRIARAPAGKVLMGALRLRTTFGMSVATRNCLPLVAGAETGEARLQTVRMVFFHATGRGLQNGSKPRKVTQLAWSGIRSVTFPELRRAKYRDELFP
jgi:hypothetical protein